MGTSRPSTRRRRCMAITTAASALRREPATASAACVSCSTRETERGNQLREPLAVRGQVAQRMLLHRCRLLPRCRLQDVRLSHTLPASVDAATRVLCWLRAGGLLRYCGSQAPFAFFLAGTAPHTPRFFSGSGGFAGPWSIVSARFLAGTVLLRFATCRRPII